MSERSLYSIAIYYMSNNEWAVGQGCETYNTAGVGVDVNNKECPQRHHVPTRPRVVTPGGGRAVHYHPR